MFFSSSFLKDELLKSSSGIYFTFSPTVFQVERIWPKEEKVCTFHYNLRLSVEKKYWH